MHPLMCGPTSDDWGPPPSSAHLAALFVLRRARQAAVDLKFDPWEFAVNLTELLATGLTGTDLRELVAVGLAEHAHERLRASAERRSFRRIANLALTARTCFVLTEAGERLLDESHRRPFANGGNDTAVTAAPRWDRGHRQLWYGERLVKWFRVPADSQETILAAFEEDGWPPRIDDPLPMLDGQDPRERLHEGVKGLNRGQVTRVLVFRRDGTGEGVMWEGR